MTQPRSFRRFGSFRPLLIAAILLPCVALSTLGVLYSQNSLYLNNDWIVSKRMPQMGIAGADEYLLTRMPLARNVLNLGQYFGYQEVVLREILHPVEISFDFEIPERSYVDVTFNRNDDRFSGIRLSELPDFPSMSFESTTEGEFLTVARIQHRAIAPGWHTLEIKADKVRLVLSLDGGAEIIPIASQFLEGLIGFRSGLRGAKVDHVAIKTLDGSWVRPSFKNFKHWPLVFVLNFLFFASLGTAVSQLASRKSVFKEKERLFTWFTFALTATVCLGMWYAFDFYYYSSRVHRRNGITRSLIGEQTRLNSEQTDILNFEELRYRTFSLVYGLSGGESVSRQGVADRGYPMDRVWRGPIFCGPTDDKCMKIGDLREGSKSAPLYRVLFVGTSQTIGAGALTLEDTFFALVHRYLRDVIPGSIYLESINISVSGSHSPVLLKEYDDNYLKFRPDVVVINLSGNDQGQTSQFEAAIDGFLKQNELYGIKTILLEEANSSEKYDTDDLLSNHEALRRLAKRYNVPVYSLHNFLSQPTIAASGALWWDYAHLTSYGQGVVGRWLAPKVLAELQSTPATTRASLEHSISNAGASR
jgi:lysophospholipase L1-like esterase